ncbi:hypothetical protein H9L01_05340 [Erysipelothrix inopinata]|uniref:Uncharacterized protein n=1 Tax=Erysipelothrix inopinata TaxID=225084 RepID=A0A7G9RW42_9FIRM|nr:hypothetical protein [Erysipelothrix inopinata]QNN59817.1 hypothetical protein H9L01_05340 [Erysipelothrix inopinata]
MKNKTTKIIFVLMGVVIFCLIRDNKQIKRQLKSENIYHLKVKDHTKPFYVTSIDDIKIEDIIDFSKPVHFDSVHLNFDFPNDPTLFQIFITREKASFVHEFHYEIIE